MVEHDPNETEMLTKSELESFYLRGYTRITNAIPANDLARMQALVWSLLEARGVRRGERSTWSDADHPSHNGVKHVTKLQALRGEDASPESYPAIREALDQVFTSERTSTSNWGQALVTLPLDGEWAWRVPPSVWHFDHVYETPGYITGVNLFLLIDDVEPGGGGTAVVRNSPRLMDRYLETERPRFARVSEQNRGFLNSHPWLSGLKVSRREWSAERDGKYLAETDVDGIPASIETLNGRAGDVFICHPALYHAPSMNIRDRPRLMRTQRIRALARGRRDD